MVSSSAALAHGVSFNLCAARADRLAEWGDDLVMISHDRIPKDAIGERLHRESIVAVDVMERSPASEEALRPTKNRISRSVEEHLRILTSISHDLQTPITRMRLRVEALGKSMQREKIVDDLREMEHLVREGIRYARGTLGGEEASVKIDPSAFLESLVFDYQDMGLPVSLSLSICGQLRSCPRALRRVLGNLVDNALKYAGSAEVDAYRDSNGSFYITVSDRGPGIPESELAEVLQPFYRLAVSRRSHIGGSGLGLAIAAQLTSSIEGTLTLSNREGGGLMATIALPSNGMGASYVTAT